MIGRQLVVTSNVYFWFLLKIIIVPTIGDLCCYEVAIFTCYHSIQVFSNLEALGILWVRPIQHLSLTNFPNWRIRLLILQYLCFCNYPDSIPQSEKNSEAWSRSILIFLEWLMPIPLRHQKLLYMKEMW